MQDPPYPTISAGHLRHETCEWAQDQLLQQFSRGDDHQRNSGMLHCCMLLLCLQIRGCPCWVPPTNMCKCNEHLCCLLSSAEILYNIRSGKLTDMLESCGWPVIETKDQPATTGLHMM